MIDRSIIVRWIDWLTTGLHDDLMQVK